MHNDRLIMALIKKGLLTADPDTGAVYYKGRARGYVKHGAGYLRFTVTHKGKRRILRNCRCMWIFCTDKLPPYGMQVNHTGAKDDDKFKKLELLTGAANVQHAHKTGRCNYRDMRRDPTTGQFLKDMAEAPF